MWSMCSVCSVWIVWRCALCVVCGGVVGVSLQKTPTHSSWAIVWLLCVCVCVCVCTPTHPSWAAVPLATGSCVCFGYGNTGPPARGACWVGSKVNLTNNTGTLPCLHKQLQLVSTQHRNHQYRLSQWTLQRLLLTLLSWGHAPALVGMAHVLYLLRVLYSSLSSSLTTFSSANSEERNRFCCLYASTISWEGFSDVTE